MVEICRVRARGVAAVAVLAVVAGPAAFVAAPAGATSPPTGAAGVASAAEVSATTVSLAGTAGAPVSFGGGDVVSLPSSVKVFSGLTGAAGAWKAFSVPTTVLPAAAAGSVWLTVRASGAASAGQVTLRPAGTTGTGTSVLDYPATQGTVATSLVRLGETGLQVKTSGGAPTVTVEVSGWVPKTSGLVVPSVPVAAGSVAVTSTATKAVTVAGVGGVPADATAVVVQVRTTAATAAGSLALWSSGTTVPTAGVSFPAAAHTFTTTVAPVGGKVQLRTLAGGVTATLKVLGWGAGPVSLSGAGRAVSVGAVPGDGVNRQLRVSGVGTVPTSGVRTAMVSVSAPTGATIKLWDDQQGTEAPELTFTSRGGTVTVPARVSATGSVDVAVTGSGTTRLLVVGWSVDTAGQRVSFVPLTTTSLVGPAEVTATAGAKVTVDRAAVAPPVGGHVLVRPPDGSAPYLGEVLAKTTLTGGRDQLTLGAARLHEAFADYDVSFHGHQRDAATAAAVTKSLTTNESGTAATTTSTSTTAATSDRRLPLGLNAWECSAELTSDQIISTDVDVDITPYLDVDLSGQVFDFSAKGTITATVTLGNGVQASCWLDPGRPLLSLPVGATGLAMKIGVTGRATVQTEASLSFTNTTRAYAAASWIGGEADSAAAAGNSSSVTANGQVQVSLDLGIEVVVGPLQPPGTEEYLTAYAGVTIGTRFDIGRGQHRYGQLRGPRCLDLTATPHLDVGAGITGEFFPDVTVSLPSIELPEVDLYKGPCYGWTGTISYTGTYDYRHVRADGTVVTDARASSLKLTLVGEPMVWGGGPDTYQAHTWTGSASFRSSDYCTESGQASGSGSVSGFSAEVYPHLNLRDWDHQETPLTTSLGGTWADRHNGGVLQGTRTATCPGTGSDTSPWTGSAWPSSFEAPVPSSYLGGMAKYPEIHLVGEHISYPDGPSDDDADPDGVVKYAVDLVRHEYQRS